VGASVSGVMFSSESTEYETPPELFDELWEEFGPFDIDPCCHPHHYTAQRILCNLGRVCFPPEDADVMGSLEPEYAAIDGLIQPWRGRVYMNPPYGRKIGKWVEKAVHEVQAGNAELVVALLPARTDTRWWQRYIVKRFDLRIAQVGMTAPVARWVAEAPSDVLHEVRFLPGRLKFVGATNSAPFPSAIVVWRGPGIPDSWIAGAAGEGGLND